MPILSSRPLASQSLTDDQVAALATPSVNIVHWLATKIKMPDTSFTSITSVLSALSDVLNCMELDDFVVVPIPTIPYQNTAVVFEVAVKPVMDVPYVVFNVTFRM